MVGGCLDFVNLPESIHSVLPSYFYECICLTL